MANETQKKGKAIKKIHHKVTLLWNLPFSFATQILNEYLFETILNFLFAITRSFVVIYFLFMQMFEMQNK